MLIFITGLVGSTLALTVSPGGEEAVTASDRLARCVVFIYAAATTETGIRFNGCALHLNLLLKRILRGGRKKERF